MRKTTFLITIAGVGLAAACHSAPPPETPAPQPTEAEIALQQRNSQDSLFAARRATADSVEMVRAAERASADSIEQVRLAAETAGLEAAEESAELREELGVMVHFDVARAQIQPEDSAALDRKVAILKANPAVRIRITGACDDRGSDQYNMALGERRAAAVTKYLVSNGIDVARLDEASFGKGSPIDSGNDEAAWAQNRRAEFLIVGGDMPLATK